MSAYEQKVIRVCAINKSAKVPAIVNKLAAALRCDLDVCRYERMPSNPTLNQCFVRFRGPWTLQEAVDKVKNGTPYKATIPKQVPELNKPTKGGKLKLRQRVAFRIPTETLPAEILKATQRELMRELQLKYSGLYNLSRKTGHLLLEDIARTLYERLKLIMDSNPDKSKSCFTLAQTYRKYHPHFGDFHMILGALHKIEDEGAQPRTQLSETHLLGKPLMPALINNMSLEQVKEVCSKYSERINKKILAHIRTLDSEPKDGDSEEETARKQVAAKLKSLAQFMPFMIKQVIAKQFVPQKAPFHRITVYGEPFLPPKLALNPIMHQHHAVKIRRSDRIHNMIKFNIPSHDFSRLAGYDGSTLSGAKLIVRSSDAPLYKPTKEFSQEINAMYGAKIEDDDDDLPDDDDMDDGDDDAKMDHEEYQD